MSSWAAIHGRTVNVEDAYYCETFDFVGTRAFDEANGYRSRSFLTVPMKNHEGDIVGVLQLINALDRESGEVVPFSGTEQQLVESLASQAAVAITKKHLIDDQKALFDAFIQLIANAIDRKSPHTGGHCRRVPMLTNMLAEATCDIAIGPLKDFSMTEDERYCLNVAGWLHDCGKIITPEYIVGKATKLEVISDRISEVDTRFEVLKRDREIAALKRQLQQAGIDYQPEQDEQLQAQLQSLDADRDLIRQSNIGGETMEDDHIARVKHVAKQRWVSDHGEQALLDADEIYRLTLRKGTLTTEERQRINGHMDITLEMLESLPYPKNLKNVPEYAGGHHEKMDGTGYPRGLSREQMSVPARIMGIADIFEALTAADRPYKQAMPLSQALTTLGQMKLDNHIDPDLFDVFIHSRVYLRYAKEFLAPEQIDEFELADIPGYRALGA